VLWELEDGNFQRFRCHVGHGFTAESLAAEQGDGLEFALWSGLRALEEQAALRRRMVQHAEHIGRVGSARELDSEAKEAERRAALLRRLLTRDAHEQARVLSKPAAADGKRAGRGRRRRRSA
jgi:two-component system chemotaxis response regulator CheB